MRSNSATKGSIVVVGGSGGLSERYRAIALERGLELRHFENRVPNGTRRILGKVAAVIIMVGMVSHSLRDQVKGLVSDDAPVVYLRSASVSAMRNAVESTIIHIGASYTNATAKLREEITHRQANPNHSERVEPTSRRPSAATACTTDTVRMITRRSYRSALGPAIGAAKKAGSACAT
jgi:hypothetical protein